MVGAARWPSTATPAKQAGDRAEAAAICHSLSEAVGAPRVRDLPRDLALDFALTALWFARVAGSWL